MKRSASRTLLATMVAAAALLAPAGSANAGLLSESATDCPSYEASAVFSRYLDPFRYALAPGGDMESVSGWTFSGGARLVAGSQPVVLGNKPVGKSSLLLPRGATATSAPMCVGLHTPTVRFFARRPSFALLPLLTVEGVYTTRSGGTGSLPFVGVPLAGGGWSLQLPMVATGALLELGDQTMMRFRIRAAIGEWQVDDFYVDPMRRT